MAAFTMAPGKHLKQSKNVSFIVLCIRSLIFYMFNGISIFSHAFYTITNEFVLFGQIIIIIALFKNIFCDNKFAFKQI